VAAVAATAFFIDTAWEELCNWRDRKLQKKLNFFNTGTARDSRMFHNARYFQRMKYRVAMIAGPPSR
jgi:hypothetical protein